MQRTQAGDRNRKGMFHFHRQRSRLSCGLLVWAVLAQADSWALSPEGEVGFHEKASWEMCFPCSSLLPRPCFCHHLTWGLSVLLMGQWSRVPFYELFHHVAGIMNNSGANKRTFECSADGRCHTGKINPQIYSLMESSCRQMLSCTAASSQTDYFLAHIVYSSASPGISSFALQHFYKHSYRVPFSSRLFPCGAVLGGTREKTDWQWPSDSGNLVPGLTRSDSTADFRSNPFTGVSRIHLSTQPPVRYTHRCKWDWANI